MACRLAARVPDDSLVMSSYIGAVSFEWAHYTAKHPRTAHLGVGYSALFSDSPWGRSALVSIRVAAPITAIFAPTLQ